MPGKYFSKVISKCIALVYLLLNDKDDHWHDVFIIRLVIKRIFKKVKNELPVVSKQMQIMKTYFTKELKVHVYIILYLPDNVVNFELNEEQSQ